LDEPTNHLDIPSKEILKNALKNYEGTFLIVSHDREFLKDLTNRIWDIEDQELKIHHFELDAYLKYKAPKEVKLEVKKPEEVIPKNNPEKSERVDREQQKKIQKIERNIEEAEQKLSALETSLSATNYDNENYSVLLNSYEKEKEQLDRLIAAWEALLSDQ